LIEGAAAAAPGATLGAGISYPTMPGCGLLYACHTHRALSRLRHLLQDPALITPDTVVPGLTLQPLPSAAALALLQAAGDLQARLRRLRTQLRDMGAAGGAALAAAAQASLAGLLHWEPRLSFVDLGGVQRRLQGSSAAGAGSPVSPSGRTKRETASCPDRHFGATVVPVQRLLRAATEQSMAAFPATVAKPVAAADASPAAATVPENADPVDQLCGLPVWPRLAPTLSLGLRGLRLCMLPIKLPMGSVPFETALLRAVAVSRELERGLPPGMLAGTLSYDIQSHAVGVRAGHSATADMDMGYGHAPTNAIDSAPAGLARLAIVSRQLVVSLHNGHTAVVSCTLPVNASFVGCDADKAVDIMAKEEDNQTGGAASNRNMALGDRAPPGSLLLATDRPVVLDGYVPHEFMAVEFELVYTFAEDPFGPGGFLQQQQQQQRAQPVAGASDAIEAGARGAMISVVAARQTFIPVAVTSSGTTAGAVFVTPDASTPAIRLMAPKKTIAIATVDLENGTAAIANTFTRRPVEVPLMSVSASRSHLGGPWMDGGGIAEAASDAAGHLSATYWGGAGLTGLALGFLGVNMEFNLPRRTSSQRRSVYSASLQISLDDDTDDFVPDANTIATALGVEESLDNNGESDQGTLSTSDSHTSTSYHSSVNSSGEQMSSPETSLDASTRSSSNDTDTSKSELDESADSETLSASSDSRGRDYSSGMSSSSPLGSLRSADSQYADSTDITDSESSAHGHATARKPHMPETKVPTASRKESAGERPSTVKVPQPLSPASARTDAGGDADGSFRNTSDESWASQSTLSTVLNDFSPSLARLPSTAVGVDRLLSAVGNLRLIQSTGYDGLPPSLSIGMSSPSSASVGELLGKVMTLRMSGAQQVGEDDSRTGMVASQSGRQPPAVTSRTGDSGRLGSSATAAVLPEITISGTAAREYFMTRSRGWPLSGASRAILVRLGFESAAKQATDAMFASSGGVMQDIDDLAGISENGRPHNIDLERSDPLSAANVSFTFLGFSPNLAALGFRPAVGTTGYAELPNVPKRVFLRFQFYRCAPVQTQPLYVVKEASSGSLEGGPPLFLLDSRSPEDVRRPFEPYRVAFYVDPSRLPTWAREDFIRYLQSAEMQIDVYDVDTLLPLGYMFIRLSTLLRQQRPRVECTRHYPLFSDLAATDTGDHLFPSVGGAAVINTSESPVSQIALSRAENVGSLLIVSSNEGNSPASIGKEADFQGRDRLPPRVANESILADPRSMPSFSFTADPSTAALAKTGRRHRVRTVAQPIGSSVTDGDDRISTPVDASLATLDAEPPMGGADHGSPLRDMFSTRDTALLCSCFGGATRGQFVDYERFVAFLRGDFPASSLPESAFAVLADAADTYSMQFREPLWSRVATAFVAEAERVMANRQAAATGGGVSVDSSGTLKLRVSPSDVEAAAVACFSHAESYVRRKFTLFKKRLQAAKGLHREHDDSLGPEFQSALEDDPDNEMESPLTRGEAAAAIHQHIVGGDMFFGRIRHTLKRYFGLALSENDSAALLRDLLSPADALAASPASLVSERASLQVVRYRPMIAKVVELLRRSGNKDLRPASDEPRALQADVSILHGKLLSFLAVHSGSNMDNSKRLLACFRSVDFAYSGRLSFADFNVCLLEFFNVCFPPLARTDMPMSGAGVPSHNTSGIQLHATRPFARTLMPKDLESLRDEDLRNVRHFRESEKQALARRLISEGVSFTINTAFGRAELVEHTFRNPFNTSSRFIVSLAGTGATGGANSLVPFSVRVVATDMEWSYLRLLNEFATGAHRNDNTRFPGAEPCANLPAFAPRNNVTASGSTTTATGSDGALAEFLLEPGEQVVLPFLVQLLDPIAASSVGGRDDLSSPSQSTIFMFEPAVVGNAKISIYAADHGHAVSVLDIKAKALPPVVHQTMTFFCPEHDILRGTVCLTPVDRSGSASLLLARTSGGPFVRIPDADVIADLDESVPNFPQLRFKFRCGSFPTVQYFHVLQYSDPLCTVLERCVRICIHPLLRFDLNTMVGQCSTTELVARGGSLPLPAVLASSHPTELQTVAALHAYRLRVPAPVPLTPFTLVPAATNRIQVLVRPLAPGPRRMLVNLVGQPYFPSYVNERNGADALSAFGNRDATLPTLLAAWCLQCSSSMPAINKMFDIPLPSVLPVGGVSKKIPFMNRWAEGKVYHVYSSRPDLVSIRPESERLPISGRSSGLIRFVICDAVEAMIGTEDVLLFVIDDDEKSGMTVEETLLLRLIFTA
jgi:hypothetical protein